MDFYVEKMFGGISMKIFIKKISEVGTEFKDEMELESFMNNGDELKMLKPVSFEGVLKKGDDFIEVNGKISLEYSTFCHLCGTEFSRCDEIEANEVYRREPTEDEYLLTGDEIELDEMILDNLRLKLPVRFLCKEDCKGVCTRCGKNLNFEKCECKEEIKVSPFDILKGRM